MLHACEGAPGLIQSCAAQSALHSVEDAQGVVKGQCGNQALLWQILDMTNCPVMHPTAAHVTTTKARLLHMSLYGAEKGNCHQQQHMLLMSSYTVLHRKLLGRYAL